MTSDSTLRLRCTAQTLCEFWFGVEREYPLIGQRAGCIRLPFATSYLCEMGFSAVASLKTNLAFLFSSAEKNERSSFRPIVVKLMRPSINDLHTRHSSLG